MSQSPPNLSPADAFLLAATPDPDSDHRADTTAQAENILAANPNLPNENFYAACALGDPGLIHLHLQKSPALATTPGGPRNWPPLCYLTFSKFLPLPTQASPLKPQDFLAAAQLLLDHAADPNSHFTLPSDPSYKESALYGAAGLANNPALTQLLLNKGADPNDPESLYHASEFQDNAALKILLPRITDFEWLNYCMCHKMDMEDPAGLQIFLAHPHSDPDTLLTTGQRKGDRPLHFALTRHRSDTIITLLLQHRANPTLPDARNQTPHQLALKLGRLQTAELLRHHRAPDDSTPKLHFLAALSSADEKTARDLIHRDPALLACLTSEDHSILIDAAQTGHTAACALMLSPPFNFNIEIRKPKEQAWDGTPLHHACYHAHPQTVQLLLQKSANPHALHTYGGNALTTTLHAAIHNSPTDLPAHLQTLTLLVPHFPKEALEKARIAARSSNIPELISFLESLTTHA